jgi:hypothetical protein
MSPVAAKALFDPSHAAFMERGASVHVASRDDGHLPSLARAAGTRVAPDRRRVSVYLLTVQAAALLADLARCGEIAAVFSEQHTHRTIQLKGTDAAIRKLDAEDRVRIARYLEEFADNVAALGIDPLQVRTLLTQDPATLVAVDFTPSAAFDQTPGPNAGAPLASA